MFILSYLLPFFWPTFILQLFYNNWLCEETAGRGLPLETFGVKTEEMEQVCVLSFICSFRMYFCTLISLSLKYSTALYLFIYPIYVTLFYLYLQKQGNLLSRPCNAISPSFAPAKNAQNPPRTHHSQITTPDHKI